MSRESVEISVIVPVYDEQESLRELHAEVRAALEGMRAAWEVVYVDDGSSDGSAEILAGLHAAEPEHVRVARFRRNYGQTAALAAGFELARGRFVVTLDADLQNDPADVPLLLAKLEEGYDIVTGWRRDRRDGFLLRRLPSIAANRLIALVTGASVHDTGCTLKAFRRELTENLPIYAEQHRFLPVLSLASGARLAEVVVNHRARRFGRSKYGIGRASRVLLDLLTMKMLGSFSRRPLEYFALIALPFAVLGPLALFVTLHGAEDRPVLAVLLTCLFGLTAIDFVLLGLLAELAVKASDVHGRNWSPLVSVSKG